MKPETLGERALSHENNYDFLRFSLASLVVLAHSFAALDRNGVRQTALAITQRQVDIGQLAVEGFFCVSGLLVTASWDRDPHFPAFIRKRALRIYPGFLVCWLVCALVVAP